MTEPEQERRHSARIARNLCITIKTNDVAEQKCMTKDISAGGVFFYCPLELVQGSPIDIVMVLPPEITAGQRQWVCARGKVVRIERDSSGGGQHGVAAKIEGLGFMPEL